VRVDQAELLLRGGRGVVGRMLEVTRRRLRRERRDREREERRGNRES
jgi:hypothetical protein